MAFSLSALLAAPALRTRAALALPCRPWRSCSRRGGPEYPWQIEFPLWAPAAKLTEAERRADFARFLFEHEETYRDEGLHRHSLPFYGEGRGFFRFSDGTFAFSRDRANWPALKEAGFFREYGM